MMKATLSFLCVVSYFTCFSQLSGCYFGSTIRLCVVEDTLIARFVNAGGMETLTYFVGPATINDRSIQLNETTYRYYKENFEDTFDSTLVVRLNQHDGTPIDFVEVRGYCDGRLVGSITDSFGTARIDLDRCDKIEKISVENLQYGFPVFESLGAGNLHIEMLDLPGGINNVMSTRRECIRFKRKNENIYVRENKVNKWDLVRPVSAPSEAISSRDYLFFISR